MSRFLAPVFVIFTGLLCSQPVFNVKDYGATGIKAENAAGASGWRGCAGLLEWRFYQSVGGDGISQTATTG